MISVKLIYDEYTPAVEAQITRDLIAMRKLNSKEEFAIICEHTHCERLAAAFNIPLFTQGTPNFYVVYKTTEWWPEHPDETEACVVMRDMYVSQEEISIDPDARPGYYLPEQGRLMAPKDRLTQRGPTGKGAVDPTILMVWGGPTMNPGIF